jgi:hypothetical protein
VGDHVALVGVIDRPEGLRLVLGELEGGRDHELLVRPGLLAENLHLVRGLVLGDGHPVYETDQDSSNHHHVSNSISHGSSAPFGRCAVVYAWTASLVAGVWRTRGTCLNGPSYFTGLDRACPSARLGTSAGESWPMIRTVVVCGANAARTTIKLPASPNSRARAARIPSTNRPERRSVVIDLRRALQFAGIVTTGAGTLSSFSDSVMMIIRNVKTPLDL